MSKMKLPADDARGLFIRPRRWAQLNLGSARWLRGFIVPLVVGIVWEYVARHHLLSSSLFPPLTRVANVWTDWILRDEQKRACIFRYLACERRSEYRAGIARVCSRVDRWLNSRNRHGLVYSLAFSVRPDGSVAATSPRNGVGTPLDYLVWYRLRPAVGLVFIGAFFPAYVNTMHGVMHVEDKLIRAARMLGASRQQLLFRVVLPAALPTIATGLRIGLGFSWMCVIVSEMLSVKSGIGYVLWDSYYYANLGMVVAAMASVGLLGYLSDRLFGLLLRSRLRWADQGDRA